MGTLMDVGDVGDPHGCRRKAQMYKRNLSHLLTREHSGQGHADMLAHIHTHSHTYKHILAATATHPRMHSCTGMHPQEHSACPHSPHHTPPVMASCSYPFSSPGPSGSEGLILLKHTHSSFSSSLAAYLNPSLSPPLVSPFPLP